MIHRWHLSCFILFFFNPMHLVFGQSEKPFSGELIYKVTKVDSGSNPLQPANNENEETKVIIYAKDSLLKIVNFSAQNGFQECLKHLTKNKSILLLNINKKGYAIRMKQDESIMNGSLYSFEKKCGFKKNIGGLKSKKIILRHPKIKNELTCLYSKKIAPKYANTFDELPGLPTIYYLILEDGLYRYQLESYNSYAPPLSMFMIPEDYQIVSMEEFMEIMNSEE